MAWQVADLQEAVDKLNKDKVNLEREMEMEEENIVNRLQRKLESLLSHYRTIEQKLEAKGLSLKDFGIQPTDYQSEYVSNANFGYFRYEIVASCRRRTPMFAGKFLSGSKMGCVASVLVLSSET